MSHFVKLTGLVVLAMTLLQPEIASAQSGALPTISFGRVMPGTQVEKVLTVRNPTDQILEISTVESPDIVHVSDVPAVLLPGMGASIKLSLQNSGPSGLFTGKVVLFFKNIGYPSVEFGVDGFLVPPIEFQPFPAFFVATDTGKPNSRSIEIINHRDEPLILLPVRAPSDRYSLDLETIKHGRQYRLTLTLDGNSEPGEQIDEVAIQSDPPLDNPLKVQINTKIKERVYYFPDSVDIGALPLTVATDENAAKSLSQILMVYRPDTDDFEVEASLDLDYIDMTVERGPKGDRYQMDLTLIPEKVKPGKIEGTVTIKTNDKEFPVLEVPITGWILD